MSLAVGLPGPAAAQLSDDETLSHSLDLVFGDRSEALQSLEVLAAKGFVFGLRLTRGGTTWTVTEEALLGDGGRSLQREAGHVAYWFAWAGYLRDAELYVPPE